MTLVNIEKLVICKMNHNWVCAPSCGTRSIQKVHICVVNHGKSITCVFKVPRKEGLLGKLCGEVLGIKKNFYAFRRSRQARSNPGTGDRGGRCAAYIYFPGKACTYLTRRQLI